VWDGENRCVRNPRRITNGTLRHYFCGTLTGEYVKPVLLCIWDSCVFIGYCGLSSWSVCICRCSIACLTQSVLGFIALSLVGSIAIHCIPLPAGTVLVVTVELLW